MAYLALVFGGLEDTDELQTLLAVLRLVMAASTVALGLVRLLLTRKLILVGRVPIAILFQCVRFTDGFWASQGPDGLETMLGLRPLHHSRNGRITLEKD